MYCAFPYKAYSPALVLIIFQVFSITLFVTVKLLFPEFLIGLWKYKVTAVFMGVPETSVYKDYCVVTWKNKVWFSRITFITDTVSKTGLKQGRAYLFFGFCVLRMDVRHIFMAVFWRKNIHTC